MQNPVIEVSVQAEWKSQETPTGRLRFITRDGKKILQQEWSVRWGNNMGQEIKHEWFDVPLVDPT